MGGGAGATISIHKLFMDSSNQNPGWTEFPNFNILNCLSDFEGELSKKWNQDMEILGL